MVFHQFEVHPIAHLFKQYVFGDKQYKYKKVNNSISNEYNIYNESFFFWTDSDINIENFIITSQSKIYCLGKTYMLRQIKNRKNQCSKALYNCKCFNNNKFPCINNIN